MKTELERLNARNQLTQAVLEYIRVFFNDDDKEYSERLVAGAMAFLQVNYYKDIYYPVIGVEEVKIKKHWWEFWGKSLTPKRKDKV